MFRQDKILRPSCSFGKKNVERETWDGFRFGVEGAKEVFHYDAVYPIEEFEARAKELLRPQSASITPCFATKSSTKSLAE